MKDHTKRIALVVFVGILWCGLALAMQSYSSSLLGSEATHKRPDHARLSTQASGDLPGSFFVSFDYNGSGVTGGDWEYRIVSAEGEDLGTLSGTVSSGAVTRDEEGRITSVSSLSLVIVRGSGQYSSVISGNGSVDGTSNYSNSSPFSGTITLNF